MKHQLGYTVLKPGGEGTEDGISVAIPKRKALKRSGTDSSADFLNDDLLRPARASRSSGSKKARPNKVEEAQHSSDDEDVVSFRCNRLFNS